MSNQKSFVFNYSNSQPLVTPPVGRHHVCVNALGQLEVIDHRGKVVPQNFSGSTSTGTTAPVDKVYAARISQNGTNAPTLTELTNNYGAAATPTYGDIGAYVLILNGVLLAKSYATIVNGNNIGHISILFGDNAVLLATSNHTGGTSNNILNNATIVITTPA